MLFSMVSVCCFHHILRWDQPERNKSFIETNEIRKEVPRQAFRVFVSRDIRLIKVTVYVRNVQLCAYVCEYNPRDRLILIFLIWKKNRSHVHSFRAILRSVTSSDTSYC